LPRLIAGWSGFIIPFKRMQLTEAINPVKVYEMLATGKPIAAVPLPELLPMAEQGLVALAQDAQGFARALDDLLAVADPQLAEKRREFARENTWEVRTSVLSAAIETLTARVRPREPVGGCS
jgi:hypothetical protein